MAKDTVENGLPILFDSPIFVANPDYCFPLWKRSFMDPRLERTPVAS